MQGMSPFLFVKLVQQRRTQNHAKPAHRVRRSSGQPFTGTTRSAGVGEFGLALAILVGLAKNSDIGRVGKKMVLRRIPIYFLSTIFHDLKPKLGSQPLPPGAPGFRVILVKMIGCVLHVLNFSVVTQNLR